MPQARMRQRLWRWNRCGPCVGVLQNYCANWCMALSIGSLEIWITPPKG